MSERRETIGRKVNGVITYESIGELISQNPNKDFLLVMDNTKNQIPETLKRIADNYPQIKFSVIGGLDREKEKFNNYHYQSRTYYNGFELARIIEIFNNIELGINKNWTDEQQALYVYKQLCNSMTYSEVQNSKGEDAARGISGLLYGKAVCAGFAMIYKEAMDRIGIECYYQNKQHRHAWNIIKVGGKYRSVELTWDVYNKSNKGCSFSYFNLDTNFYGNQHHDISGEKEETRFPLTPYTQEKINDMISVINRKNTIKGDFTLENGVLVSPKVKLSDDKSFKINKMYGRLNIINLSNQNNLIYRSFDRVDGKNFIVIKVNEYKSNKINNYILVQEEDDGKIAIYNIFTENLLENINPNLDSTIANSLLSRDRLAKKVNGFYGYMGYVGKNQSIYANQTHETEKLEISRFN